MSEAMVTGRMSEEKKRAGNRVLAREHLKPSQAINLMYQRLIEEKNARFLTADGEAGKPDSLRFQDALSFVDQLSLPQKTKFDDMSDAEIKTHRLRAKGVM